MPQGKNDKGLDLIIILGLSAADGGRKHRAQAGQQLSRGTKLLAREMEMSCS